MIALDAGTAKVDHMPTNAWSARKWQWPSAAGVARLRAAARAIRPRMNLTIGRRSQFLHVLGMSAPKNYFFVRVVFQTNGPPLTGQQPRIIDRPTPGVGP